VIHFSKLELNMGGAIFA